MQTAYESGRAARVHAARTVVKNLFTKYGIENPNGASQLIREGFTQEDLDAFKAALEVLNGEGVIG